MCFEEEETSPCNQSYLERGEFESAQIAKMSTSSVSPRRSDASASTAPSSPASSVYSQDQSLHVSGDLPWILHHILHPECAAELPLTVMFRFNSDRKPPSLRDVGTWWQLDRGGVLLRQITSSLDTNLQWKQETESIEKLDLETIPEEEQSLDHKYDSHMIPQHQELLRKEVRFVEPEPHPEPEKSEEPKEVCSLDKYLLKKEVTAGHEDGLPPWLIRRVVERAFPSDYARATFTNALTALDYIRDLEFTRRSQLRAVGQRWGVDEFNWRTYFGENACAPALRWYERMERIETQIQKWFAEIYIGLRIWIMLDTIKVTFEKNEIFAMLNTLYPPVMLSVPSDEISITQLRWHRRTIFGWILTVETEGTEAVVAIEEQLLRGKHSWRTVTLCLDNYLKHAIKQIEFARKIPGPHPFHNFRPPFRPRPPTNPPSLDPVWIPEIEYEEKIPWLSTPSEDIYKSTRRHSPPSEVKFEDEEAAEDEENQSMGSEDTIRASCLPAPLFAGSKIVPEKNGSGSKLEASANVDAVVEIKSRGMRRKNSFASLRGLLSSSLKSRGGI